MLGLCNLLFNHDVCTNERGSQATIQLNVAFFSLVQLVQLSSILLETNKDDVQGNAGESARSLENLSKDPFLIYSPPQFLHSILFYGSLDIGI